MKLSAIRGSVTVASKALIIAVTIYRLLLLRISVVNGNSHNKGLSMYQRSTKASVSSVIKGRDIETSLEDQVGDSVHSAFTDMLIRKTRSC